MVAIARALSRASGIKVDVETLTNAAVLSGAGLAVVLLLAQGAAFPGVTPEYDVWNLMGWI